MPDRYCRNFQGPAAAVASTWARSVNAPHNWRMGRARWGTNSKPFEVVNEAGLVGVAKPGANVSEPDLPRAAHEKIASDLGFLLELPIPPVTLCDSSSDFDERYVAVSAWAFSRAVEWQKVVTQLSSSRRDLAVAVSSAMAVFDTWIAASDRKDSHVLVNDDGDDSKLDLAYIDYAFSLTKEWATGNGPVDKMRPALPIRSLAPFEALNIVDNIEALDDQKITQIVNRIPPDYLPDRRKRIIISNLLSRRAQLRALVAGP